MTQPNVPEPNGYEAVVAELRRIADALETVPPGFGVSHASVDIHAGEREDSSAIAAVDAVAMAVLGKPGALRSVGNGYHHHAEGDWKPVHFAVYQRVPGPADLELERLRARVAELEAGQVSR